MLIIDCTMSGWLVLRSKKLFIATAGLGWRWRQIVLGRRLDVLVRGRWWTGSSIARCKYCLIAPAFLKRRWKIVFGRWLDVPVLRWSLGSHIA